MFWIIVTVIMVLIIIGSVLGANYFKKQEQELLKENRLASAKDAKSLATGSTWIGIGASALWVVLTILSIFYTQDPGQASVLVSFSGQVEGIDYEQGVRTKAPWSNRVEYDIRNNTLSYIGTGETNNAGGDANGPQITFQDADGVTGNIDLVVRYSIRGDSVRAIYEEYKTQPEFVNATLANDVRAETREIVSKYHTLDLFNNRDAIKAALTTKLQKSWDSLGVDVEEVYLQEVRYSDAIKATFDEAQNARTKVETAKADQERAKIEAETNKIKAEALTEPVLKEKLIDALKNGSGTYIIDTDNIAVGVK